MSTSSVPQPSRNCRSLIEICAELLDRDEEDAVTVQVARVVTQMTKGDIASICEPVDVAKVFRRNARLPLVEPQDVPLTIAFEACVYPRRVTKTEREQRMARFSPVLDEPVLLRTADILRCLRKLAYLPVAVPDAEVLSFLTDLNASDDPARLAGGALYLATLTESAIGGEGDRLGVFRIWEDERKFVRFFRSVRLVSPPSTHFPTDRNYDRVYFKSIGPHFADSFSPEDRPFALKAVDMEAVVWGKKPHDIPQWFYELLVHDFWLEQHNRLNSGFPYFGFGAHFPRWWKVCALNFRNEALKKWIQSQRTIVPHPVPIPTPDPIKITPELLYRMWEGWRLVRTTFYVLSPKTPWDHEELRTNLDEFWRYHINKDAKGEHSETIEQLLAKMNIRMGKNAAFNHIRRIKGRLRAYSLARERGMGNAAVKRRLEEFGSPVVAISSTIASLARMASPSEPLLWALLSYVFLRPGIEPQHPDPWDEPRPGGSDTRDSRYTSEVSEWCGNPMFADALVRGAEQRREPNVVVVEALRELVDVGSRPYPSEDLVAEALGRVCRWDAVAMAWVARLLVRALSPCCRSLGLQLRRAIPGVGDVREWVVPVWMLVCLERYPNRGTEQDNAAVLRQLLVEDKENQRLVDQDRAAVRYILNRMRQHCQPVQQEEEVQHGAL